MIWVSPQWMLLAGIALSFLLNNANISHFAKFWSSRLLQLSVVLLGASLNFNSVLQQGAEGVYVTFFTIIFVFIIGLIGIKLFKIDHIQGWLITVGTAICGGSAMGALAPVLGAGSLAITISFAVVFLLNALAIFIFPSIGTYFNLSQDQFGIWAAIAIHDTSSVVATSSIYGQKALEVATTIKLTRALWIIPITLVFSLFQKRRQQKLSFPWFILGFVLVSLIFTFLKIPDDFKKTIIFGSKWGFSLTLFLIGLAFSLEDIKKISYRPLVFGILLWLIISISSLFLIISAF